MNESVLCLLSRSEAKRMQDRKQNRWGGWNVLGTRSQTKGFCTSNVTVQAEMAKDRVSSTWGHTGDKGNCLKCDSDFTEMMRMSAWT